MMYVLLYTMSISSYSDATGPRRPERLPIVETQRMSMGVRELGVWASLVTTVVIYGGFFAATASGAVRGGEQIGLLIGAVIAQVVALVVFHIGMAIWRGEEQRDERDVHIDLRAFRNAYVVLAGTVATVALAYVGWAGVAEAASAGEAAKAGLRAPSAALMGNALLLCFVAAELTHLLTQVVLYRRGA